MYAPGVVVIAEKPQVVDAQFHFETSQQIVLELDRDVTALLGPGDFQIVDAVSGTPTPAIVTINGHFVSVKPISFSFPDGRWKLLAAPNVVRDFAGNATPDGFDLEFFTLGGDANRDGRVNLSDFNVLAANFGQSNRTFSQGDFNYDGLVNLSDFNILAARFGQSVLTASAERPPGLVTRATPFASNPMRIDSDQDETLLQEVLG